MAEALLEQAGVPPAGPAVLVPHAGWVFSGATAAMGIRALSEWGPETVIAFGAVHGPDPNAGSVYSSGEWETPVGVVPIDAELAVQLCRHEPLRSAPEHHRREHSIEVNLPLLRIALPEVRIVPIGVRPGLDALVIGQLCASTVKSMGRRVGFLASSDLTHYGPAFGFEPHGSGPAGVRWAKDCNDRRMIEAVRQMRAEDVLTEATLNRNACGAGAIAALLTAARELGATRYVELGHTTSAEVAAAWDRDASNSVGYEAGVFTF
jgi:AmmeMemoRadiSam system protein B